MIYRFSEFNRIAGNEITAGSLRTTDFEAAVDRARKRIAGEVDIERQRVNGRMEAMITPRDESATFAIHVS